MANVSIPPVQLSSASSTLFTVPGNNQLTMLELVFAAVPAGSNRAVDLHFVPPGGSAAAANRAFRMDISSGQTAALTLFPMLPAQWTVRAAVSAGVNATVAGGAVIEIASVNRTFTGQALLSTAAANIFTPSALRRVKMMQLIAHNIDITDRSYSANYVPIAGSPSSSNQFLADVLKAGETKVFAFSPMITSATSVFAAASAANAISFSVAAVQVAEK